MNHPKITRKCPWCGAAGTDLQLSERHTGAAIFYVECIVCYATGPAVELDYDSPLFRADSMGAIATSMALAVDRWNSPRREALLEGEEG